MSETDNHTAAHHNDNNEDQEGEGGPMPIMASGASSSSSIKSSPRSADNIKIAIAAAPAATTASASSSVPEVPRWRFVNTAKKSLGYSSQFAGSHVPGKTAEELAAKYTAPDDDNDNDNDGSKKKNAVRKGEVEIGKVAVPSFMLDKDAVEESYEANVRIIGKKKVSPSKMMAVEKKKYSAPSSPSNNSASGGITATATTDESSFDNNELLQQHLQQDIQRMEQRHKKLQIEIQEIERRKDSLEREREMVREDRDNLMREREAAAATTAAASTSSAAEHQSSRRNSNDNNNNNDDDDVNPDDYTKRRKCKKWGVIILILLLLGAIGALLGVMLGGGNNNENDEARTELRGPGMAMVDDGLLVPTTKPTTTFTTPSPVEGGKPQLILPSASPTTTKVSTTNVVSTEVSIMTDITDSNNNAAEQDIIITCPSPNKKFTLTIDLPPDPSLITWSVLDKCTLDLYYRCLGCYSGSPPNVPVAFSGCLPTYNEERHESREFVLRMIHANNDSVLLFGNQTKSDLGFEVWYDNEAVYDTRKKKEEGEGEGSTPSSSSATNGDTFSFVHFGEGGACSEAPSEPPKPTQLPSISPSVPPPTFPIAPKQGCTPFTQTSGACGRAPEVEFKVLMPRGLESFDSQMFGAAVTFVGNTQSIIALASGIRSPYVHIFQRYEDPFIEGSYGWAHLTSLELPDSLETNTIFFGASLDSNDEGYIVVGAPSVSSSSSGKVYIFSPNSDYTEWTYAARLDPDEDLVVPSFGAILAMDGRLVAVGSPEESNGKGSVYLFGHSGPSVQGGNVWARSAKLSPDGVAGDVNMKFGSSVSIFGDTPATLAVGAPGDIGGGSAWVYKRSNLDWSAQKLVPRDVQEGDQFGSNVVISGCTVAVSSPMEGVVGAETTTRRTSGTVRMFDWDPDADYWVHRRIIEPTDDLAGSIFGSCIALEGDTLLVGSPWGREGDEKSGVVYHFERIGGDWAQISAVVQKEHVVGDADDFGCPLSLSGDMFIAGSRGDSTLGMDSGAAFVVDICPTLI